MIEQINTIVQIWWNWMWPMFWQVSVLIILFSAVDLLLRRHIWPQVRYAVWLLVLVKLVLPPSMSLSTGIISQARTKADRMAAQHIATNNLIKPLSHGLSSEMTSNHPDISIESLSTAGTTMSGVINENFVQADSGDIAGSNIETKIHWRVYVMAVWLAVMVGLFLWMVVRLRRIRQFYAGDLSKADLPQWF